MSALISSIEHSLATAASDMGGEARAVKTFFAPGRDQGAGSAVHRLSSFAFDSDNFQLSTSLTDSN